jgi:hypothetical protein|tara:strand:+ start:726 stop:959 length:234 start_codon:yes stop_codon:yes gene_type:complete
MKSHTIHPTDSPRAAAIVLFSKLYDLSVALKNCPDATLEYGTTTCPVCKEQADNLSAMIDKDNGAVLCAACETVNLI